MNIRGDVSRTEPADVPSPVSHPREYDVVIVGGGPAGLSAAAFCGRKFLRTAVFERKCWGGILTCHCPDKRIDNYPGIRRGILARDLADFLEDGARGAGAELIERGVEEITRGGGIHAQDLEVTGKVVILACGSTAAEFSIPGERELADIEGIHYMVRDPSLFSGKRVVIIGGGETAVSHVQRLIGVARHITLVHRQAVLRSQHGLPEEVERAPDVDILCGTAVEKMLGFPRVAGLRLKNLADGRAFDIPSDAVVIAVGRVPNSALFRDLGIEMAAEGRVVTDEWQKTTLPRFLAIGDVTSSLKMIITAVAQAAAAAHEAYTEIRSPYWR